MTDAIGDGAPHAGVEAASVSVSVDAGGAVVALHGDIDLASADALPTAVAALRLGPNDCLRIDLSEVSFLDARGLRAILQCEALLAPGGVAVKVRNAPCATLRLLEMTNLGYLIETVSPDPLPLASAN